MLKSLNGDDKLEKCYQDNVFLAIDWFKDNFKPIKNFIIYI